MINVIMIRGSQSRDGLIYAARIILSERGSFVFVGSGPVVGSPLEGDLPLFNCLCCNSSTDQLFSLSYEI